MTIIMWFRNDLRTRDLPALTAAFEQADYVLPVFIFDSHILHSKTRSSNRNRFLLESLTELRHQLRLVGSDLVVREGKPSTVLVHLAQEFRASKLHYTTDYTPYARKRDSEVENVLKNIGVSVSRFPGHHVIDNLAEVKTTQGQTYRIFTPFWKQWMTEPRRNIVYIKQAKPLPTAIDCGNMPEIKEITDPDSLSPFVLAGGESAAQQQLDAFLEHDLAHYISAQNNLGANQTSQLSAYIHFGCISVREIEASLPSTNAATVYQRQLCWRDFYQYVLFHNPNNLTEEFQKRYRALTWPGSDEHFIAWQEGRTGYPLVDAAMRQLKQEGWMHNRGRLIVGSFLTKHLGIDWREGQNHFMRWLCDGDHANNNGNWQWIASVGVDPAPLYRRLYNPTSQAKKYDPDGRYIRKYVPELRLVPSKRLAEPWTMTQKEQQTSRCTIGSTYPEPIVDHRSARLDALERYRITSTDG